MKFNKYHGKRHDEGHWRVRLAKLPVVIEDPVVCYDTRHERLVSGRVPRIVPLFNQHRAAYHPLQFD